MKRKHKILIIAKFSEYMCDRLIIECNRALENQRIAA